MPRNETEQLLVHIWRDILRTDRIGIDDNFFEIGGHSLLIARVVGVINEAFKINIPLVKVFNNPTIRTIAVIIEEVKRTQLMDNQDKQLVLLKEGVSRNRHLFFIHAGNGDAEAYVNFSKNLPGTYNYWAIKAQAMEDCEPLMMSIEGLAQSYIQKIRAIQPEGTYFIAGWSVGAQLRSRSLDRWKEWV